MVLVAFLVAYLEAVVEKVSIASPQRSGLQAHFADGGPISGPGTFLVGEKGPELLNLGAQSGSVTPNDKLGSQTYVTYNINAIDSKSFDQMLAARPQTLHAIVQQGMQQSSTQSFR